MTDPQDIALAERLELASQFIADPVAAHAIIFRDDNEDLDAPFHEEMVKLYHSDEPNVIALCFRGSAKSTKAERAIALQAASGLIKNAMIVGESFPRAVERLQSIRRILQRNKWLRYLYGDAAGEVEGDTWRETRIVLSSDAVIWALGSGQAIRGAKHGVSRPDMIFVDDLESKDTVGTPEARAKIASWFWKDLVPARAKDARIRIAATPLHPEALSVTLSKHPSYKTLIVPVEYIDADGARQSSWPAAFPLSRVDTIKQDMFAAGEQAAYAMEYMVTALDPASQLFKKEMFHFQVIPRSWQPVFIAIDPARTTKKTSATTGIVVASPVGRRWIVWEAHGLRILPDEVVSRCFDLNDRYEPVAIGIEKDGLEQFLEQPLRHEQMKRRVLLPLRFVKAPKGKTEFIGRLQPLMAAGDITFAGAKEDFIDTINQFLDFPTGLVDIPNAMAYLPDLFGGSPVYDDISSRHVMDGTLRSVGAYTLAINAGSFGCSAVLFQYTGQILIVHQDWVSSDLPGSALPGFVQEAMLACRREPSVVTTPFHFDVRNSFGLLSSLRGVCSVRKGGEVSKGREFIRDLLRSEVRGSPRLLLTEGASWTRRALTAGFVWEPGRTEPKEGLYRVLVEGLEAAVAPAAYASSTAQPTAVTAQGVRYQTADPYYR
jgi:hypothetical protein